MPSHIGYSALITGATQGMGRAIAEKLAQHGYNLLLTARSEHALQSMKAQLELQNKGIRIAYLAADVSQHDQLIGLTKWIESQPDQVDVLVNNVGIFKPASVFDESDADFHQQMQVNYYTPHFLSRAVGRRMKANRRGHIFNISSIASREPVSTAGTYTVTKFAVMGLTHVLREELRSYRVKVTEIIPGSTLTSSWEGTDVPANEFIMPADIAEAIATCLRMSEGASVEEIVIKPRYGNR